MNMKRSHQILAFVVSVAIIAASIAFGVVKWALLVWFFGWLLLFAGVVIEEDKGKRAECAYLFILITLSWLWIPFVLVWQKVVHRNRIDDGYLNAFTRKIPD